MGDRDATAGKIEAQRIKSIIQYCEVVIVGRDSSDELPCFYGLRSQRTNTKQNKQTKNLMKALKGNPDQVGSGNEY